MDLFIPYLCKLSCTSAYTKRNRVLFDKNKKNNLICFRQKSITCSQVAFVCNSPIYSRLSLTQLCITQYYHLSRADGLVPVFSLIYYCNSTTFISTTAKSIKLITRYEKLVPLINFSVFYNAQLDSIPFI